MKSGTKSRSKFFRQRNREKDEKNREYGWMVHVLVCMHMCVSVCRNAHNMYLCCMELGTGKNRTHGRKRG